MSYNDNKVEETELLLFQSLVPGGDQIKVALLIVRSLGIDGAEDDNLVNAALRKLETRSDVRVFGSIDRWRESEIKLLSS